MFRLKSCPDCRYDLSHLRESTNCPECGFAYNENTLLVQGRLTETAPGMRLMAPLIWFASMVMMLSMPGRLQIWILLAYGVPVAFVTVFIIRQTRKERRGDLPVKLRLDDDGLHMKPRFGRRPSYRWVDFTAANLERLRSGRWKLILRPSYARPHLFAPPIEVFLDCDDDAAHALRVEIQRRIEQAYLDHRLGFARSSAS